MELNSVIGRDHPSFGCGRATFIFSMAGGRRTLLVGASNPWAVALMERLCGRSQAVSESCRLLAVVRDHGSVGTRSESANEASLVDFVLDVVDRHLLAEDPVAMYSLSRALSNEEKDYMNAKLDADNAEIEASEPGGIPALPEPCGPAPIRAAPAVSAIHSPPARVPQAVLSALCGLGFSKKDVTRWAESFDGLGMSNGDAIKAGCRAMAGGSK